MAFWSECTDIFEKDEQKDIILDCNKDKKRKNSE